MPVACARATGATPATAATTNNATSRPMASLPQRRERETGYPGRRASFRATGRNETWCRDLEPNAGRENERLATAQFSASLREREKRRALQLERGPAQQVEPRP